MTNQANVTDISFNKNDDNSVVAMIDDVLISHISEQSDVPVKTKPDGTLRGLGNIKKRAQTLKAMSKKLTDGGENLLGGIENLSKDAINKLQKKEINDDDINKEEDDYWHQPITALKVRKKLLHKLAGHQISRKTQKKKFIYEIPEKYLVSY